MRKLVIGLVVTFALAAAACGQDELVVAVSAPSGESVPAEVVAVLDEWWAANDRADGSVADLYT